MKTKLKNIIYTIDSSEITNYVLAVIQIMAALSGFLSHYFKTSVHNETYYTISVLAFIILQALALLYFIVLILASSKYRAIKLRLRRNTGRLYDKTANITNVALRLDTINIMLKGLQDKTKIYDIGKIVGGSFYNDFESKLLGSADRSYKLSEKLEKWKDYDSTSGMGKFEISYGDDGDVDKIKIINPFTGDCGGNLNKKDSCQFLHGYVESFLNRLYGKNVKMECEYKVNPRKLCEYSVKLSPY